MSDPIDNRTRFASLSAGDIKRQTDAQEIKPDDIQETKSSKKGKFKAFVVNTAKKILKFLKLLFITGASVVLYSANPSLFALGFVVGLVVDGKVREIVAKVQRICAAKPWVVIVIGVGSFLALPITIATASFVCGAYVSSKIAGMVPPNYNPSNMVKDLIKNNVPNFIQKKLPEKCKEKLADSAETPLEGAAG